MEKKDRSPTFLSTTQNTCKSPRTTRVTNAMTALNAP